MFQYLKFWSKNGENRITKRLSPSCLCGVIGDFPRCLIFQQPAHFLLRPILAIKFHIEGIAAFSDDFIVKTELIIRSADRNTFAPYNAIYRFLAMHAFLFVWMIKDIRYYKQNAVKIMTHNEN